MAVDRGYGSGKSRSAANSSARRRAAEGKMTKGKKGGITSAQFKAMQSKRAESPLGQLADTVLGFALPVGKVKAAAAGLRAAGKISQASALASRIAAKEVGQGAGRGYSSLLTGKLRSASESVFPRNSGARSGEYLGMNSREITANLARKTGRAAGVSMEDIRAISKATANSTTGFTNFSKRVPKVVRGFGTVNPEGYAALQKLPDFLGQGAKQIARKIKKTPKRGGR